ncbi:MAG TPA: immune inhibitor A domain-containing protein, partial [Prevotella sp.]
YKYKDAPARRINGIGLFCHEFSHTLGLPDMYTDYPDDNQEMEYWDLMDAGEYTDNGYTPTPYTPWEKETMGWVKIDTLKEAQKVTLQPGDFRKIVADNNEGEYLILENMQQQGWARKLYGHGMLVYKVDYKTDVVNFYDRPNNIKGQPGMTLVAADSLLINSARVFTRVADSSAVKPYSQATYFTSLTGDPYPGTQNVTTLARVKLNRSTLGKPLYHINEDASGVITFNFLEENIAAGIEHMPTVIAKTADNRVFTIDGRLVGTSLTGLPKGIYIVNKKKIVIH